MLFKVDSFFNTRWLNQFNQNNQCIEVRKFSVKNHNSTKKYMSCGI